MDDKAYNAVIDTLKRIANARNMVNDAQKMLSDEESRLFVDMDRLFNEKKKKKRKG